jgi:trans-aconitate methyltransferase
MERVPEPELMTDPAQALAYAGADFTEPHERFVALLREKLPDLEETGRAIDLGCGPGDVTFRVARALPGWTIDAVDGSPAMLALAREACERLGLAARVRFREVRLPGPPSAATPYDLIVSNSLLHHLADPATLWSAVARHGRAGAAVFAMDLLRSADEAAVRTLVARYAAGEPEVLRRDFDRSLRAAYRPEEVRAQLVAAGLGRAAIEVVSDRHWIAWGRR